MFKRSKKDKKHWKYLIRKLNINVSTLSILNAELNVKVKYVISYSKGWCGKKSKQFLILYLLFIMIIKWLIDTFLHGNTNKEFLLMTFETSYKYFFFYNFGFQYKKREKRESLMRVIWSVACYRDITTFWMNKLAQRRHQIHPFVIKETPSDSSLSY